MKIAKTELGDETLSWPPTTAWTPRAGYLPMPGGEKWLTRTRVQMTRCWLGHIALTPDPAYDGRQGAFGPSDGEWRASQRDPWSHAEPGPVRSWSLMAERYERLGLNCLTRLSRRQLPAPEPAGTDGRLSARRQPHRRRRVHVHVGGRVRVHRRLQQDPPRRLPGRENQRRHPGVRQPDRTSPSSCSPPCRPGRDVRPGLVDSRLSY